MEESITMTKRSSRIATIALAASFLLFCHSITFPHTAPGHNLSELAWLAGNWQTDTNGRLVSDEHWALADGGIMIGMSRTVAAGDKLASFEFLRIEQRGEDIFYVANVKGRCPATDFKLTRLSGQEAVFENPEHDFPKRIIYRKKSSTEMTASIDAGEGTKSQEYSFHSIANK
jgi:Domain of unknown function (DUF6265)